MKMTKHQKAINNAIGMFVEHIQDEEFAKANDYLVEAVRLKTKERIKKEIANNEV